MDEDDDCLFTPPSLVPLPTPSRARRRSLSALIPGPGRALSPASKRPAWISLQGRLVGAEEATSARAVGGGLSREEAVAFELFSPLQRVLVVAVMAAAAKESRKGSAIAKLQRSVEIRDEVLQNMQKKLEDLCEQMYSSKDQPKNYAHKYSLESDKFRDYGLPEKKDADLCSCGRSLPQLNPESVIPPHSGNLSNCEKDARIESGKIEIFKTGHLSMGEPEERRMSDLSDFSSVTSSVVDIQLSTLAEEQDLYNLRKECEEKDAIINELTAAAHVSNIAVSKRISELEEIIRRKNMIITKLKKDMVVLEQKVVQLTRQRRPSTAPEIEDKTIPAMATNILYDMSSSSPSSSDSDTPMQQRERQPQASVKSQSQPSAKSFGYSNLPANKPQKHRSVSPVKASRSVPGVDPTGALRPKHLVTSADAKRTRRHTQQEASCAAPQKRWV